MRADQRWVLDPEVEVVPDGDGVTLFHRRTGRFWRGNVGLVGVCERLRDGATVSELVSDVCSRHTVAPEVVAPDMVLIVTLLRRGRLVRKGRAR